MKGNKVNKGFFTYLMVFVGLAIAAVVICCGVMIISPSVKIAGYGYRHVNSAETYERKGADGTLYTNQFLEENGGAGLSPVSQSDFDKVLIKTDSHKVVIRRLKASSNLLVSKNSKYTGFYKVADFPDVFKTTCKIENKVLIVSFTNPNGLNLSNSGEILIQLPDSSTPEKQIEIQTTSGSVDIGGSIRKDSEELLGFEASNVSIKTITGNITFNKHAKIVGKTFSCKTERGTIDLVQNFGNEKTGSGPVMESISFSTKNGTILCDDIEMFATKVNIENERADVKFKTIHGNVFLIGKGGRLYVDKIDGGLTADKMVTELVLNAKFISGDALFVQADNCDINILESTGKISIEGKSPVIVLKKTTGTTAINISSGSVLIEEPLGNVKVETKNAEVKIVKLKVESMISTTSGNINIEFAKMENKFNCNVKSVSGNINAKISNEELCNLNINAKAAFDVSIAGIMKSDKGEYKCSLNSAGINSPELSFVTEGKVIVRKLDVA